MVSEKPSGDQEERGGLVNYGSGKRLLGKKRQTHFIANKETNVTMNSKDSTPGSRHEGQNPTTRKKKLKAF